MTKYDADSIKLSVNGEEIAGFKVFTVESAASFFKTTGAPPAVAAPETLRKNLNSAIAELTRLEDSIRPKLWDTYHWPAHEQHGVWFETIDSVVPGPLLRDLKLHVRLREPGLGVMRLGYTPGIRCLTITIAVENTYGGGRAHIDFNFEVPERLAPPEALQLLRKLIQEVVAHEVDESIMLTTGERPFDPHNGGGVR